MKLSYREYIIQILTSTQPNSDFMSIITLPFLEYQWDNCSFIVLQVKTAVNMKAT